MHVRRRLTRWTKSMCLRPRPRARPGDGPWLRRRRRRPYRRRRRRRRLHVHRRRARREQQCCRSRRDRHSGGGGTLTYFSIPGLWARYIWSNDASRARSVQRNAQGPSGRYRGVADDGAAQASTRSDKLSSSVARHRLVMWSFLSSCENVASRSGPGRQERSASRARGLSLRRK